MIKERLKKLRAELRFTQKEFAEKLGLNQATYTNYEYGNRDISNEVLENIALKFNINADWLLTGRGEMFYNQSPNEMNDCDKQLIEEIKNNQQLDFILEELRKDELTTGILYSLLKSKGLDKAGIDRAINSLKGAFEL